MKSAYFGQCPCGINIDKNNYPEATELDINPSSNPNPIHRWAYFWPFHVQSLLRHHDFLFCVYEKIWGGIQSPDQKSIWNEKSQLHEIDA